jgi:Tol biopolymer transport system component
MAKQSGVRWKSIALKDEKRLTAGLVHHRWPAFSHDGRWLAFAASSGHDATWVLTDRRGRVARTLDGPADGGASFGAAGDGSQLAFGRRAGATSEIWLMPGGGAPPVRLLGGDGRLYREPAYSPDGTQLAFACGDDASGRTHLELLDISTGKRTSLTHDAHRSDGRPAFAPDGELYFEGTTDDGDVAIYALSSPGIDGGGRREIMRVTVTGAVSRRPAPLSHDLVLVERQLDGGGTHLVLIDRRSVRERDLTPDGAEHREPAVLKLGSGKIKLAFTALTAAADGEPRRFDVCTARLKGLTLVDEAAHPDVIVPPAADAPASGEAQAVNPEAEAAPAGPA